MRRRRREILAVAAGCLASGLAGCTGDGDDIQDSDGDGVIDSEDYAPQDASVQRKSDVGSGESSGSGSDAPESGEDASGGSDGSGGDSSGGAQAVSYPSHSGRHSITARDNYWAWEFSVDAEFVLEYRVVNLLDENYDFDVLLYGPPEFEEYVALANEQEDGVRPEYLEGSEPGVTTGVEVAVRFQPGTYYLVVDNTDLSDAGDFGTEETRRVRVDATTREP